MIKEALKLRWCSRFCGFALVRDDVYHSQCHVRIFLEVVHDGGRAYNIGMVWGLWESKVGRPLGLRIHYTLMKFFAFY